MSDKDFEKNQNKNDHNSDENKENGQNENKNQHGQPEKDDSLNEDQSQENKQPPGPSDQKKEPEQPRASEPENQDDDAENPYEEGYDDSDYESDEQAFDTGEEDAEDDSQSEAEDQQEEPSKGKKKRKDDEKKMPFLEHLEELRWTLMRSIGAIVLAAIVCFFFSEHIVTFLRDAGPKDLKLIFLSPTEGFMTYIKVSMFGGLLIALPYVAYEVWKFIVPGLLEKERKLVPPIVFFTVFCFFLGALFAYEVIIGLGMKFLLGFQTEFLEANITISKYLGFVVTIVLVFGIVFELPVLSYFLTSIGILEPGFLKRKRAYGIVTIFIIAAMVTPPDIFTQLMLAGPLIILYEISIVISGMVKKKQLEKEAMEEEDEELD